MTGAQVSVSERWRQRCTPLLGIGRLHTAGIGMVRWDSTEVIELLHTTGLQLRRLVVAHFPFHLQKRSKRIKGEPALNLANEQGPLAHENNTKDLFDNLQRTLINYPVIRWPLVFVFGMILILGDLLCFFWEKLRSTYQKLLLISSTTKMLLKVLQTKILKIRDTITTVPNHSPTVLYQHSGQHKLTRPQRK